VRIVALNIQSGGARRSSVIASALSELDPDVVVLGEAYPSGHAQAVLDGLRSFGLKHQATASSSYPKVANAVVLASRLPLADVHQPMTGLNGQRVLEAFVGGLLVNGAYFPLGQPKVAFWRDEFLPYAYERLSADAILLGDWNSGSHYSDEAGATLHGAPEFATMTAMGWCDAWRTSHPTDREFTWFSHAGNGFRLDHAFVSPSLASRVTSAAYIHGIRERGVSDHSALVVEVE
jgi:exodeoxyribonuclease-3